MDADTILEFWFETIDPKKHFAKDPAFDAIIRTRFSAAHRAAARGELFEWRDGAAGRLAEIVILDQFSRNLFRDRAEAFACDAMALALAQEAVRAGADHELPAARRAFVYMPYMHSESARIHEVAIRLFDQPGLEKTLEFERSHKAIIDRFGRYPHRNAALGRPSTEEEQAFLAEPGSSF